MKANNILPFLSERFANASLGLRIVSSLVLAPVALLLIYVGGFFFNVAVIGMMGWGFKEWMGMVEKTPPRKEIVWAYYGILGAILLAGLVGLYAAGLVLGVVLFGALWPVTKHFEIKLSPWVILGVFYLGASGVALMHVRGIQDSGVEWGMELTFYLVAVVWATDIGAYLAGSLIGGPKIYPAISPSKTWAGLAGGAVLAAVAGLGVNMLFGSDKILISLMMGIILAVVSQAGDFFESFIKRRFEVKDSGTLIPGHGGLLDRIDGLVLAALFFSLLLSGAMQAAGAV